MNKHIYNGRTYAITLERDPDMSPPWEDEDGHGPVRKIKHYRTEPKRPGERPLNTPMWGEIQFLYDWNAALDRARHDGWAPSETSVATFRDTYQRDPTVREYAALAVREDFEHLQRYVYGEWYYVVVTVSLGGEEVSLGGVESHHYKDHIDELCAELEPQVIAAENAKRLTDAAQDLADALRMLLARCELELDQSATHTGMLNCSAMRCARIALEKVQP